RKVQCSSNLLASPSTNPTSPPSTKAGPASSSNSTASTSKISKTRKSKPAISTPLTTSSSFPILLRTRSSKANPAAKAATQKLFRRNTLAASAKKVFVPSTISSIRVALSSLSPTPPTSSSAKNSISPCATRSLPPKDGAPT